MNLDRIIHAAFFTPSERGWGLPLLFEGQPGVGKSSILAQHAKTAGLPMEVLVASLREPSDFLGLPMPGADGFTEYATPAWAKRFVDDGGVIFLDEINTAPPAVQAALLRVVLDGVVGEQALHEEVRFVAAQNSTADAAGGWDLAPPLANRFGHIPWPAPSADAWSKFMMNGPRKGSGGADYKATQDKVLRGWSAAWASAMGAVSGYLQSAPDKLMMMPKSGSPACHRAWPSPRSWSNATRALASAKVHGLDQEDTEVFVGAFVGVGVAAEFFQWQTAADLPNPHDVLSGKVAFTHRPGRLDVTMAVLASCASVTCHDKSEAMQEACWGLLDAVYDSAADVVLMAATTLVEAKLMTTKAATNVLAKASHLLAVAM